MCTKKYTAVSFLFPVYHTGVLYPNLEHVGGLYQGVAGTVYFPTAASAKILQRRDTGGGQTDQKLPQISGHLMDFSLSSGMNSTLSPG